MSDTSPTRIVRLHAQDDLRLETQPRQMPGPVFFMLGPLPKSPREPV